jgi:hypothetical protein
MRICVAMLVAMIWAATGAGCAGTLENIVETRHQARIEEANSNKRVMQGGSDGIGAAFASPGMRIEK